MTVPGRELTSFGDGTWQVGVDVVPGTYTSTGGPDCRYALRAAVTGSDIAASTVGRGPATVVLSGRRLRRDLGVHHLEADALSPHRYLADRRRNA